MAENIINKIWDTDAMANYSQEVYGPEGVAYNSPNTFQYHIDANDAAAAVPSNIIKGAIPGFGGETLGLLSDVAMPALALGSSPFYDAYQGITRVNDQFKGAPPGYAPTFSDYAKGVWDEDIGKSMIGRTLGAGQNLVRNAKDYGTGIMEALNPSKQTVIDRINAANNLSPMGTDVIGMDEMNTYGQVPMGTDVIGMDEMNTYGNRDFTNVGGLGIANEPGVEQEEYLETPSKFQNFKSKMGDMMSGIGGMFKKLPTPMNLLTGMFKESPEQRAMMDLYNSGEYQDVLGQIPGAENLNPVYGMGAGYGLSGALGKRLAMRNSQKTQDRISKLSQQRRDKFAAQSAAIEQAISLEKAKIGARIGASGKIPTSGGGGTPDQGGTYGGYSYGGEGQQAGRQGYGYGLRDGGLATLFARRG